MTAVTVERPTIESPDQDPETGADADAAAQAAEAAPSALFEKMSATLERMEVPDGYRAEIIRGNIVMSPWSKGVYRPIVRSILRQLEGHEPEGHCIDSSPHLFTFPEQNRSFGPDIHVSDEEATLVNSIHLPGDALSLVAELTSASTAEFDREDKVEVYGSAKVPVYILVDMLRANVTVYSSPGDRGYQTHVQVPFGEKVAIPAPFECELDTSDWKS